MSQLSVVVVVVVDGKGHWGHLQPGVVVPGVVVVCGLSVVGHPAQKQIDLVIVVVLGAGLGVLVVVVVALAVVDAVMLMTSSVELVALSALRAGLVVNVVVAVFTEGAVALFSEVVVAVFTEGASSDHTMTIKST